MKNIVLVGAGKWGVNYLKTLATFDVSVKVASRNNWMALINEKPDGVIIATPPDSHIEIAIYALNRNIPIIIEKPLALSLGEAELLKGYKAPILVNHSQLFAEGYEELCRIVNIKKTVLITTSNYGDGPIRDYSSLWDYGPHSLAMILYLSKAFPKTIKASRMMDSPDKSTFHIIMDFETFKSVSTIGNGMLSKNSGINILTNGLEIKYDDICKPKHHKLPLQNALELFVAEKFDDDRFGLDLSFKVLKLLEHCDESIRTGTMIYTS